MTPLARRNALAFGPGTLGRDMVYFLVATYTVYFITEVVRPGSAAIWWLTAIMVLTRILDSLLDFVMGSVVERTRSRWGQFKPWILAGGILSALATVNIFSDYPHLEGMAYVVAFGVTYLLWGVAWSMNDIPYWSLLPALTVEPHEREVIGAVAKVFGTLGLFSVVIATLPSAAELTRQLGSARDAWFVLALIASALLVLFQFITLVGVKQPPGISQVNPTQLRDIVGILRRNDQARWLAICMIMFFTGFQTTTTFGPYYFKYVFQDESAYPSFAAVLGIAQLVGYVAYPLVSRRLERMTCLTYAVATVLAGYVVFFFAPRSIVVLAVAGFLIFVGQAVIVMLVLVMLSDSIEYGQWKYGVRHGSVTFALQPFIYKVSLALATGVVGMTTVLSGIAAADHVTDLTPRGVGIVKIMMLVVPFVMMAIAYAVFRRKFVIDKALHERMVRDLRQRGELVEA